MRATMHNSRANKNGVHLAKHNDRDFDISHTEHIKKDISEKNWYWHLYQKSNSNMTFEAAEKKFYENTFKVSLDAQNERHIKARNKNRVKTIDDYRKGSQTCPEETIYQIGKDGQTVSSEQLKQIAIKQINWEIKTFPNIKILDAALHVDEEGAPHLHKRQVWTAQGKDGITVSQNKALKEMGIERPDKSKKEGRYNNAKMTYTEQCRKHFLTLCKEHGINIETEPKEASKSGLTLLEYKRQQEQEKLEQIKAKQEEAATAYQQEQKKLEQTKEELKEAAAVYLEEAKAKYNIWEEKKLKAVQAAIKQANDKIKEADIKIEAANTSEQEIKDKMKSADSYVEKNIQKDKELQELKRILDTKESDLSIREEKLNTKESDLSIREEKLTTKETDLQKRETAVKEFNRTKIDFRKQVDKAYWELETLKRTIKNMTTEELEEREKLNEIDDFGQAVNSLDFSQWKSL